MSFHAPVLPVNDARPDGQDGPVQHVLILLPPEHDLFSLAMMLDLFAAANRLGGRAHFVWSLVAQDKATSAVCGLFARAQQSVVLLADAQGDSPLPPGMTDCLSTFLLCGGTVGGWGRGVLALAATGVLAGRLFALAPDLRGALAGRRADLTPTNRSHCSDRRVLTSVGRALLSDLVLHMIDQHCGRPAMLAVMDHCVIHRMPDQGHPVLDRAHVKTAASDARLEQMDRWIDANISRPFAVDEMAAAFGLSSRQIERLFQRYLNETPAAHLRNRRLTHALHLLRSTNLSVEEIARQTGHGCKATFQKQFKRKFGTVPALA